MAITKKPKPDAAAKRKATVQKQIDELKRQIAQEQARNEDMRERVSGLVDELHDLGHSYQRRCSDIRELWGTLELVRTAIAKPRPELAKALALLAEQLGNDE